MPARVEADHPGPGDPGSGAGRGVVGGRRIVHGGHDQRRHRHRLQRVAGDPGVGAVGINHSARHAREPVRHPPSAERASAAPPSSSATSRDRSSGLCPDRAAPRPALPGKLPELSTRCRTRSGCRRANCTAALVPAEIATTSTCARPGGPAGPRRPRPGRPRTDPRAGSNPDTRSAKGRSLHRSQPGPGGGHVVAVAHRRDTAAPAAPPAIAVISTAPLARLQPIPSRITPSSQRALVLASVAWVRRRILGRQCLRPPGRHGSVARGPCTGRLPLAAKSRLRVRLPVSAVHGLATQRQPVHVRRLRLT